MPSKRLTQAYIRLLRDEIDKKLDQIKRLKVERERIDQKIQSLESGVVRREHEYWELVKKHMESNKDA